MSYSPRIIILIIFIFITVILSFYLVAQTNTPWWSYEVGLIHFVGISTEHNYTIGSDQWLWLENDLKSVNRDVTPWIIFGGHRAMYLNSNYGGKGYNEIYRYFIVAISSFIYLIYFILLFNFFNFKFCFLFI